MLKLTPKLLQRLDPACDRTRLLFASLGVAADELDRVPGIDVVVTPDPSRPDVVPIAVGLVDLVLRLQPLVATVVIDSPRAREMLGDLPSRLPVAIEDTPTTPLGQHISVDVGQRVGADLTVDGSGWSFAIDQSVDRSPDENPIGRRAAATIGAGEIFKRAFIALHPDHGLSARMHLASGAFSLWDYSRSESGPPLSSLHLDAILVGAGGVGAGVVATLAEFGAALDGKLTIVDDDTLDLHNLNRVTYARVATAEQRARKVDEACRYLSSTAPNLAVEPRAEPYAQFKRSVAKRVDRRYPLVICGVDRDEARWEVQRDLPRDLIDAGTGAFANCRVDRIDFVNAGCLGCVHHRPFERPAGPEQECDAPPAHLAPSVSFVSAFAGVCATAEAMKVITGGLPPDVSSFEHSFLYGPNPDLAGRPAKNADCTVACTDQRVVDAYQQKWDETVRR